MTDTLDQQLNLPELDLYNCVVWGYTASHSQLYIRLFASPVKLDEHLYLGFQSVRYFSGPMRWSGANFRFGNRSEILNLIQSGIIEIPDNAIDDYVSAYRLFVAEKPSFTVRILAEANVVVVTEQINSHISSRSSN